MPRKVAFNAKSFVIFKFFKLFKFIGILKFFAVFGLLTASLLFFSNTSYASESCGRLTVGWIDWPPYQMVNPAFPVGPVADANPMGIDIDAAEKYLGALGCELVFVKKPWARLLKQLEEGDLDVLLGMSDTKKRRQYANFSKAYREETIWLFINAGRTKYDHFTKLEDIIGTNFRLGISRNAYMGEEFDKLSENPKFRERLFKTVGGENFQLLIGGRVDGFMVDKETGKARIQIEGLEGLIVPHKNVQIELGPVHIMVGHKSLSDELLTKLDEIIEQDLVWSEQNAQIKPNFVASR
ncbi:substrate-binding periplasmic protein [Kiloniella antarctica]|uniref:Substrate-binding periplasmic protein n=1 Tax=Kiloniella antarctica TaxID=1550907 RepID=A0ABW5BJR5_9PROT